MIDHATIAKLAELRRQIDDAEMTCSDTLQAMSRARANAGAIAETSPFLADCARDLEALASVVRLAADRATVKEEAFAPG